MTPLDIFERVSKVADIFLNFVQRAEVVNLAEQFVVVDLVIDIDRLVALIFEAQHLVRTLTKKLLLRHVFRSLSRREDGEHTLVRFPFTKKYPSHKGTV